MTVSMTITDEDHGWSDFKAGMSEVDGAEVEAGLFGAEQATNGARHELGTSRMPARPWLSVAADTGAERIFSTGARAVGAVADGADTHSALVLLGEVVVKIERDVITGGMVGGPPLAPSTVDKSGPKKLVDTGSMVNAIEAKVKP